MSRYLSALGILGLLLLLDLLLPAVLQAQGARFDQFSVTLLPQYDDPRLLILFEATLPAPGPVALAVPGGAELHEAAYRDGSGQLRTVEARFEARSDGRYVTFDSPTREIRLELYQDVIPPGPDRIVRFRLPPQERPIGRFLWKVVFPLDSTVVGSSPPMLSTGTDHLGLATFSREVGAVEPGEEQVQEIRWSRESSEPSIFLPALPDESGASGANVTRVAAGGLFLTGLALVLNGLWRRRRVAG